MIINFVGDLCLQGIDPKNYRIDEEIVSLLVQGKINVANLEAPLTLSDSQTPHQPKARWGFFLQQAERPLFSGKLFIKHED